MEKRPKQNGPTWRIPSGPQRSQNSQRPGRGMTRSGEAGPNMNPWAEKDQSLGQEFAGVDISFYSGAVFDCIRGVVPEDLDASLDDNSRRLQTEAFDLFQRARRQLEQHFLNQAPDTPGLHRSNAARRSRDVLHRLPSLRHGQREPVPSHATRTRSPHDFINDQVTRMDEDTFDRGHTHLSPPANESKTVSRARSSCLEDSDNAASSTPSTASLCHSVSTLSSISSTSSINSTNPFHTSVAMPGPYPCDVMQVQPASTSVPKSQRFGWP